MGSSHDKESAHPECQLCHAWESLPYKAWFRASKRHTLTAKASGPPAGSPAPCSSPGPASQMPGGSPPLTRRWKWSPHAREVKHSEYKPTSVGFLFTTFILWERALSPTVKGCKWHKMKRLHSTSQLGKETKNWELLAEISSPVSFCHSGAETPPVSMQQSRVVTDLESELDDINPLNMLWVIERRTYLDTIQCNWGNLDKFSCISRSNLH